MWLVPSYYRIGWCIPIGNDQLTSFGSIWLQNLECHVDLDPQGFTDPLGMFPLFLMRTADVLAPHLSVVFCWLVHLGSFPACRRQANVTPIPKGPPSSSVANYWLIYITLVLSKVFEHLVLVRLAHLVVCFQPPSLPHLVVCFQPPSLLIRKVWVPDQVHWRVGRRLGLHRLISTIREFCISSVLWVLEVLCCLYWHSLHQIN